jgi:hypothetical protein
MPEQTTATDAKSETGATPEAEHEESSRDDSGSTDDSDLKLGDAGKKALDAARQEAKRHKARADVLEREKQEREDAERSELEKVQRKLNEAEGKIADLERGDRAKQAAIEAQIPDLWDRLKGDTAEELAADAKAMAERFGPRKDERRDLGSGPRDATPAKGNDAMNERIRRAARR